MKATLEKAVAQYNEAYGAYDEETKSEMVNEEIVARFIETTLSEPKRLLDEIDGNTSLIGRIKDILKTFVSQQDKLTQSDKTLVNKAYNAFKSAIETKKTDTRNYTMSDNAKSKLNGVQYDLAEEAKKITADTSEEKRYEILKDRTIVVVESKSLLEQIDKEMFNELEKAIKSKAETIIYPMAQKLGIIKSGYKNIDLEFEFGFSKNGGLKESLSKQKDEGGNYADLAKVLYSFDEVVKNAILIEVHKDKYKGTYRENALLENISVLFSVMKDDNGLIPIKLEIKKYSDIENKLYLTVALSKIKETVVMGKASRVENNAAHPVLFTASNDISIRHLFEKINPLDENFLKYIPDKFLDEKQLIGKQQGIAKDIEKINTLRGTTQFSLSDSQGRTLTQEQAEFFKDSLVRDNEGNLLVVYHGTNKEFFTFEMSKNSKRNVWGEGFYFAKGKGLAYDYGKNIIEAFLDIKNPYINGESNLGTAEYIKDKYFNEMWENSRRLGIDYITNKLEHSPIDLLQFIAEKNNKQVADILKEYGYDGIIDGSEMVAFDSNQIKLIENKAPTKKDDIRYSLSDDIESKVKLKYGTTYNWNITGYILKNGEQLDLSGKKLGSNGNYRAVDHREIFDDENLSNGEALVEFMSRGNIRVTPESPGINIQQEPTAEQYESIGKLVERLAFKEKYFVIDFDNKIGDTINSLEYEGYISARKIVNDIKYYFAEGILPQKSLVNEFRYSLSDIDKFSERQYNDYAWAQVNDVLSRGEAKTATQEGTYGEIEQFNKKFSELTRQKGQFPQTANGEHMLSVENKIVYVAGTFQSPRISKVLALNYGNETNNDIVRNQIYDYERSGYGTDEDLLAIAETYIGQGYVDTFKKEDWSSYKELKAEWRKQSGGRFGGENNKYYPNGKPRGYNFEESGGSGESGRIKGKTQYSKSDTYSAKKAYTRNEMKAVVDNITAFGVFGDELAKIAKGKTVVAKLAQVVGDIVK